LVMTSNALSQALTAPIIGALSGNLFQFYFNFIYLFYFFFCFFKIDNYGRKPMLLICLVGTILGFMLLASAQNIFQIFLSRILDGALGILLFLK